MINQTSRGLTGLLIVVGACTSCASARGGTPASITLEPFDSQVALVYGPGGSNTGNGSGPFGDLAIPELVVYENGLVLFSCREETVRICQNGAAPERVAQLLDDLSVLGFFDDSWHNYLQRTRLGPYTEYTMIVPNPTDRSQTCRMSWTTASYDGNWTQAPGLLGSTLTLVNEFKDEMYLGEQPYQPKYAALLVIVPDERPTDYSQTMVWPFDFDPRIQIDNPSCSWVEVPQTISDITVAIPDFLEHPLGERYEFVDGANIAVVRVRPYLPGEEMRTGCVHRWSGMTPVYDMLPLYTEAVPVSTP